MRTTRTCCVCLIFDTNGLENFKGPNYQLPFTAAPHRTGLNSYPIMISVPHVSTRVLGVALFLINQIGPIFKGVTTMPKAL